MNDAPDRAELIDWVRSRQMAMFERGVLMAHAGENAIVIDEGRVMNKEGLRFHNEFIRHNLLDAVGDLYLAGGQIIGAYEGFRSGHAMNNAILHKLFTTEGAWTPVDLYMEAPETALARIPGNDSLPGISLV